MRGHFFPLTCWLGLSVIFGVIAGCLFPLSLPIKLIIGLITFLFVAGVQSSVWNILREKKAHNAAFLESKLEEEKRRTEIEKDAQRPKVQCPYCVQKGIYTEYSIPYRFNVNRNVYTCPKCKQDFGVSAQLLTFQISDAYIDSSRPVVEEEEYIEDVH